MQTEIGMKIETGLPCFVGKTQTMYGGIGRLFDVFGDVGLAYGMYLWYRFKRMEGDVVGCTFLGSKHGEHTNVCTNVEDDGVGLVVTRELFVGVFPLFPHFFVQEFSFTFLMGMDGHSIGQFDQSGVFFGVSRTSKASVQTIQNDQGGDQWEIGGG